VPFNTELVQHVESVDKTSVCVCVRKGLLNASKHAPMADVQVRAGSGSD